MLVEYPRNRSTLYYILLGRIGAAPCGHERWRHHDLDNRRINREIRLYHLRVRFFVAGGLGRIGLPGGGRS